MDKKTDTKKSRPPVVAVLGHVDHGKTSLLDTIRKTHIVKKEAGGITQSIGAWLVSTKGGKRITFIDTPGHAAFSKMRSRGAKVADIVVLVVAADDGVKPQTKEAIEHINSTNTPFIVAVTKMDLPGANLESVKGQLEKEGVLFEGRGGDTPCLGVSAKETKGIDELLETISLMAEVAELSGDEEDSLLAVVIETNREKMGPAVSVIVKEGSLEVGKKIEADGNEASVRGIFDSEGEKIKKTLPGEPALILGFSNLPGVGSIVHALGEKKEDGFVQNPSLVKRGVDSKLNIIIRAGSAGGLEALVQSLPEEASVVRALVGDVVESDVFLAKAASPSIILAFEARVSASIKKLAEAEKVDIHSFDIIYEAIEKVQGLLKEGEKILVGEAKILAEFPFSGKRVAGSKILKGEIKKGDRLTLIQDGKEVASARVVSLKKQKEEISLAKEGEECGILTSPQLDFQIGDVLVSVAQAVSGTKNKKG